MQKMHWHRGRLWKRVQRFKGRASIEDNPLEKALQLLLAQGRIKSFHTWRHAEGKYRYVMSAGDYLEK